MFCTSDLNLVILAWIDEDWVIIWTSLWSTLRRSIGHTELEAGNNNLRRPKMASGKKKNKANMRVLIAATGIVILLKLDSNDRFFSLQPWNLMMTSKNNMASLLYYVKLLESFRSHRRTQTCITVLKHLGSKLAFFCPVWPWNLKKKWPRKTLGHCFYATSRFLHHFIGIEFKLELHSGNVQFWSK